MTLYDSILLKGRQEGRREGHQEGLQEGQQKTFLIVKRLKKGDSPSVIAKELDVELDFVMAIKKELGL